jgi:hypothetical protein
MNDWKEKARKIICVCFTFIIAVFVIPIAFLLGGFDAVIDVGLHDKWERCISGFVGSIRQKILKRK